MNRIIVRRYNELDGYEALWGKAVVSSGTLRHPFTDFTWISTYSRYFLDDSELYIDINARNDDIRIFPFYRRERPFRKIGFIGGRFFDYRDIISGSNDPRSIMRELAGTGADMIDLSGIRADSVSFLLSDTASFDSIEPSYKAVLRPSLRSPYLKIGPGTWEDYFAGLKGKFKRDLARRMKKLSSEGEVEFGLCSDKDRLQEILDTMYGQHIKRREYLGQDRSIFADKKIRAFFNDLSARMFKDSRLLLFYLELDGEIIAVLQCFLYDKVLYHYIPTFDTAYRAFSPGRILNYHVVKFAFDEGLDEIDFMIGDEDYKLEWNTETRQIYDLFLFKRGFSGFVAENLSKAGFILRDMRQKLQNSRLKDMKRSVYRLFYKRDHDIQRPCS